MIAILNQYNAFINIPVADSEAMEMAHAFTGENVCRLAGGGSLPLIMEQCSTSLRSCHSTEIHSLTGRGITH